MLEAELRVRIPAIWLTELPKRHEIAIKILSRKREGKSGVRDLVEISGAQEVLEEVLDELPNEPWVKGVNLDFVESGKLVGEIVTHKCLACASLLDSHCYLLSATTKKDGSLQWRLMASDRSALRSLVARLKRFKCETDLLRITPVDEKETLTDRQREITLMAFEKGFFDTPRKIKLKDLAKLTGVSQATLSEILRKGQRRILMDYLKEHEGGH